MNKKQPRIAIVADWLTSRGGAERVLFSLAKLYPEAVIFTSVYTPDLYPELSGQEVRTSWLQKLPFSLRRKHQFLLPLLPDAFERLDMCDFDIILSSSSAFAKCVRKTRQNQVHICYCHSPTRYLYHAREEYMQTYPLPWFLRPAKWMLPKVLDYLTKKDLAAVEGVDIFLANSRYIAERIKTWYHREAQVVYPGLSLSSYTAAEKMQGQKKRDYYLAVGRFIPYKQFPLIVKAFAGTGRWLILAGTGPELALCKKLAGELGAEHIEFPGFVEEASLPALYAGARAFLFPVEEDFGLTPLEAMAAGTPVIAYNKGGAAETVTQKTGVFFDAQDAATLRHAVEDFEAREDTFDRGAIQARALEFSDEAFCEHIDQIVRDAWEKT